MNGAGRKTEPSTAIRHAALLAAACLMFAGCSQHYATQPRSTAGTAAPLSAPDGTQPASTDTAPAAAQRMTDDSDDDIDLAPLADYPFYATAQDLLDAATTVVTGQIVNSEARDATNDTVYTVVIDEVVKRESADRGGGTIDFTVPGIAGADTDPPGERHPAVNRDRDLLLLLEEYPDSTAASLVNPGQGVFAIDRAARKIIPLAPHAGSAALQRELAAFIFDG